MGAKKSASWVGFLSVGARRITASPPPQEEFDELKVLPVVTNMDVPSNATPLCPQLPPPVISVDQAPNTAGVARLRPTTMPL